MTRKRTARERREIAADADTADMVMAIKWLLTVAWGRGFIAGKRHKAGKRP